MGLRRTFRVLSPRRSRGAPAHRLRRREQSNHQKQAVKRSALRDCGRRCVYCAHPLDATTATLDHVHPRSRGGTSAPGNLVVACRSCNQLKGDLLPLEFFLRYPWAGANFMRYARTVHRALKRGARRVVSLAWVHAA